MGTNTNILLLFFGVFAILVVLTAMGEALRSRVPHGKTNHDVESFLIRVHSWWVMVILFTITALLGPVALMLLFLFASFAALREFLTFTYKNKADHLSLALGFFLILPLQYLFVGLGWTGLFTVFIPVYAFLLLPIISALRGNPDRFLTRVAETQWGLMICVYCISHVPALLNAQTNGDSGQTVLLIVFFVMVVQIGDLADYFAGRRFGHRRIAPGLSPKTLEGMATGIAASALAGVLLTWITPFGAAESAALAALASLSGMMGGLVFAAIKRDRGVKDWSHLIPGHGGLLDRLDSVIFAAPVFYHVQLLLSA